MAIMELDALVRHQRQEAEAADSLAVVRAQLLLPKSPNTVFFAQLALRLRFEADWVVDTACVNGKTMKYNPDFVLGLPKPHRTGLVVHEVMHCALKHFARLNGRDLKLANICMDFVINSICREAKIELPSCALYPEKYGLPLNLSWEEYYSILQQSGKQPGKPGDDPGGCGGVESPGDPAETEAADADWQVATMQAAESAKKCQGQMAAGLERFIGEALNPKPHWRDVLREWLVRCVQGKDIYSWAPPNRRFIYRNLYLPSLQGEQLGEIVVHVDCSGSTWDEATMKLFASELTGVLECRPVKVWIVYCDCRVNAVEEWTPDQGPIELRAVGGGGTSHEPVWQWVEEQGITPVCLISLTDGYTTYGDDPGYPVLFAITKGGNMAAPFGRMIEIE